MTRALASLRFPAVRSAVENVTVWPRTRPTAVALLALVAVQATLFFVVTQPAFFATDDFLHFRLSQERSLLHYLATPILGVYPAPGHRLATFLLHELFPLNHTVARVFFLVFLAATTVLLAHLVRVLARSEAWWTVALLAPFALSLTLVSPVWWWSNGLPVIPALFFTALALIAWLRSYTDQRRTRWLWVVAAAVAAAGAFHIKFLLIPVYFIFIRLVILPRLLDVPGGVRHLWDERLRWVAVGAAPALFVGVQVLAGLASRSTVPGERPYVAYFGAAWFHALVPVSFTNTPLEPTTPRLMLWLVVLVSQLLFWAAVVATWKRSSLALSGWGLFVLAFVVNAAMVGAVRLPGFGIEIAYWLRYYPEVVFFLPLVLALGLRRGAERRPEVAWERTTTGRTAFALFACLHVVAFVVWAPRLVSGSDGALARAWFDNLRQDIGAVAEGATALRIVDSETPEYVMPPWMADNRVSTILALLEVDAVYDDWSEDTYVVLEDGRLAAADFGPLVEPLDGDVVSEDSHIAGEVTPRSGATCLGGGGVVRYSPSGGIGDERLAAMLVYSEQRAGTLVLEVETGDADRPVRRFDLHSSERTAEIVDLGTSRVEALTVEGTAEHEVCIERIEIGTLPAR